MSTPLHQYLTSAQPRQLDELITWLRIPSISTIAAHKADIVAAARWLVENMRQSGLEHVELIETAGHPLVYGDWLHAGADKPTVLIYGHYDVQPVDPLDLWTTPPFEPTIRTGQGARQAGEDLYARGASDDKGQTFIHIKAVETLLQCTGSLPVNVKFLIEGEEEAGSGAISTYVPAHTAQLAADLCLISDTGILAPDQPVITYGLRGGWSCELTVTGPAHDLHSGMYGGATHNPNQALCELLAALHDKDGHVTVPGFYDRVQELSAAERQLLAQVPYGEAQLLADTGAPAAYGEPQYNVVERIGARPTLEICGMWGGFITEGFKTVIPSQAHAKLSCRLVPDQDPAEIGQLVEAYLQQLAPPTIKVAVRSRSGAPPYVAPIDSPAIQLAAAAYQQVFGVAPVYKREGGSIPIVNRFQAALGVPIVLLGFGLPDDNLHAPNEKFYLPNFYKGIETSIAFLQAYGARANS